MIDISKFYAYLYALRSCFKFPRAENRALYKEMFLRDGPFDFSWGGGRKSEKKYRACLEWKKKKSNITNVNTSKKNIEHKNF